MQNQRAGVLGQHLEQWFSTCGPRTGIFSLTWKLVRNANAQAPPRPPQPDSWGVGPGDLCWNMPSLPILMPKFENHCSGAHQASES